MEVRSTANLVQQAVGPQFGTAHRVIRTPPQDAQAVHQVAMHHFNALRNKQ